MSAPSRRRVLAAGLALPSLAQIGSATAQPVGPQSLRVLLTNEGIRAPGGLVEEFERSSPDLVSKLVLREEGTGWLASGLTAEVREGRPGADIVLTNGAGYALGAVQEIWRPLAPALLVALEPEMTPAARRLTAMAEGNAVVLSALPGGPFLLHRPSTMPTPPRSAAELMDFARQNPDRFQYARPRESLLGQLFVSGLPHLLGDHEPANPQTGWRRTWEYLQEISSFISYYPSSGVAAMEEFAGGGTDLTPGLLSPFLLGRNSGLLPPDTACATMARASEVPRIIPQSMVLAVPRGVPLTRRPAIEALARFLLTPRVQMVGFGRGLVPGTPEGDPVPPGAVSEAERAAWTGAMTPELASELASHRMVPPLAPFELTYMLREWDELIGARFRETR